jgi:hypothetical protein
MSHMLALSGEAFRTLQDLAVREGQTPESVMEHLIAAASLDGGRYYETEEWFRHLGMTEDEIREARELAEREDADASGTRIVLARLCQTDSGAAHRVCGSDSAHGGRSASRKRVPQMSWHQRSA